MRHVARTLSVLLLVFSLTVSVAVAEPVWSVNVSGLDRPGLDTLSASEGVTDWCELGNVLLVVASEAVASGLKAQGLTVESVPGASGFKGLHVVLSKHSDVEGLLAGNGEVVARSGPARVFRAAEAGIRRILAADGHDLQVLPLPSRQAVFVSPAHLPEVEPADGSYAPLANQISRAAYVATLRRLIAFESRHSFTPKVNEAASWALEQFKAYGLAAEIVPFQVRGTELPNVVAEITGSDHPEQIYIVGAHIDSISWNRSQAPGADDNASGSAGVLEMARILGGRRSASTVRFLLFSGEEQGLYGSKAYVKQLQQKGELQNVKAMLNLDMISFDKTAPLDLMLEGRAISHGLSDRLQANAQAYAPDVDVYRTDNAWGSDHIPFLDKGIPTTLTFEYEYDDNGNDHTPSDVFGICNVDLALSILRMDVVTLAELAGIEIQASQ